ncbi:MAG: ABC transporter substrate-binding protein, partial [Gammaproteobacteria bacterium]
MPCRLRAWRVCAVVLLLAAGGCGRDPASLPRVAANNWSGYWPLYLAVRGAAEPVAHLTELQSATEVMRAYRNGAIDIAALTLDEALVLAAEGLDVTVFLVVDFSAGGDALLATPDIGSLAALAGRRIGVEASALGAYMVSRIYDQGGLVAGAARIVELPYGAHARAFRDGAVDAVVTFDPVRAELRADGARELFSSRDIPGEIVDVLLARPDWLKANRRQVARLVAA